MCQVNDKYKFTGLTKTEGETILHQIEALKDLGMVRKGDAGGWIEKEGNLSFDGNAWVYGDARVSGDARVYGNAWVYGDARVYGGQWEKSPLYIQGTKYSVCMCCPSTLKIGCKTHTIGQWLRHGERIARLEKFAPEEISEYRAYVELAAKLYPEENQDVSDNRI